MRRKRVLLDRGIALGALASIHALLAIASTHSQASTFSLFVGLMRGPVGGWIDAVRMVRIPLDPIACSGRTRSLAHTETADRV